MKRADLMNHPRTGDTIAGVNTQRSPFIPTGCQAESFSPEPAQPCHRLPPR